MLLKGQERIRSVVERYLKKGKIPSATLILGPAGVGKTTLALDMARAILCLGDEVWGCGECRSCRAISQDLERILSEEISSLKVIDESSGRKKLLYLRGEHPDFIMVIPEGGSVKIDQIRSVKEFAYIKPALSARKVIIIDRADLMTREAGNSLLKVLEEPPADTHFILTAESRESILPTVLSRTVILNMGPLSREVFEEIVGENGELYELSEGSVSKASLIRSDREILSMVSRFGDGDLEERVRIALSMESADPEKKLFFLEILERRFIQDFMEKRLDYDKFEALQRRIGELREGIPKGMRFGLGLIALADLMEE